MSDELLYEVADNVATITLNRPERQNTISQAMLASFSERLLEADADREVRAIVVTGSGKFFCAGLDLRGNSDIGNSDSSSAGARAQFDTRNAPPNVLHNIDTPTICALNGSAAGYGMDLALGCDIRIMAEGAKLAAAFTKRGIVPESGGTWILPRLIGWSKASEIIFTGKTLSAQECEEMGLVSRVVGGNELPGEVAQMAKAIAANAPLAVQASKRMMRTSMNETFDDHIHHVYLQLLPLFQTDDFKEGMKSFMEKREAEFKGR